MSYDRVLRLSFDAIKAKLSEPGGSQIIGTVSASALVCLYFKATSSKSFTNSEKEKKDTRKTSKGGDTAPQAATSAEGTTTTASVTVRQDRREKAKVDGVFLRRFIKQLSIAFPSLAGREMLYMLVLTVLLLLRTELSLRISAISGQLAKTMIQTDFNAFVGAITSLALWSVPASIVNSGLRYFATLLHLRFRQNLSKYLHKIYLTPKVTYQCAGLGEVDTIDQRITQDVDLWAMNAADLYTTIFKPFVDVVLFSRAVAKYGGYKGPLMIAGYYSVISVIMRVLMPNFAELTANHQKIEAEFRSGHTRLMNFAEEVRFLNGIGLEQRSLNELYNKVADHAMHIAEHRASMGVFDSIMVKYGSVMVGYAVCAMAIFSPEAANLDQASLTGLYMESSQLLTNLARAIGQIIMTYKKITGLAGYTARVGRLMDSVEAVRESIKKKSGATGVYRKSHRIAFDRVPIVPPDGTVLIKGLSFYVQGGMNVLILGPNGCGKSSTFRLLGELWVPRGGIIEKPDQSMMYYVPQRPYMCDGTLREQIIYPNSAADSEVDDARLTECLDRAGLGTLLTKQNLTWESEQDWSREALSHGDKQKMAMARLYFHRPKYAILDECSSAVDLEVEAKLYQNCAELGISVITVAHRRSVWKYHNWVLKFDGDGGYAFSPMKLEESGVLILTDIKLASDPSMVGKSMSVDPTTAIAQLRVVEQS